MIHCRYAYHHAARATFRATEVFLHRQHHVTLPPLRRYVTAIANIAYATAYTPHAVTTIDTPTRLTAAIKNILMVSARRIVIRLQSRRNARYADATHTYGSAMLQANIFIVTRRHCRLLLRHTPLLRRHDEITTATDTSQRYAWPAITQPH